MEKTTILVGTIGQGVMRSHDGGETWQRIGIYQGMHSDAMVRMLAHHPRRPEVVYAGTDKGLYCSDDTGASWKRMDSPLDPYAVWAITVDPLNPEILFAGTGTPCPSKSSARQTVAKAGRRSRPPSLTNAPTWVFRASRALPSTR